MGLRLSRPEGSTSTTSSSQRQRSISPTAVASGSRTRSLSHQQNHPDEPGHSSSSNLSRRHQQITAEISRLVADIETMGGGVISPDDPRLIRLIRAYNRIDERTGGRGRRPASFVDTGMGLYPPPDRHRRGTGRQRTTALTSASADDGEGAFEERLANTRRQVLLSLAAANSSSPRRRRQWPDSYFLLGGRDRPCIFCKRLIPHDDYDLHYVMCLTRPRITYNEDTLQTDKGECAICLGDLRIGDLIARLPCLCIYHKTCIDAWFQRKQTCPEHPGD